MFTAYFRRFHALAVDDCQTGVRISARLLPHSLSHGRVDPLPGAVPTPFVKVRVHAVEVRIVLRQIPPLAACPQNIQNGIDDSSQVQPHRAAWSPVFVEIHRLDNRPLFIVQVTWIARRFVTHLLFAPVGFNWRLVPPILPARSHSLIFKHALVRDWIMPSSVMCVYRSGLWIETV